MEHLFAYGTLMCDSIMREVSGFDLPAVPGTLKGYCRRSVKGELYPAIMPYRGGCVEGVIYRCVPGLAWERLDRFEGEMYVPGSCINTSVFHKKTALSTVSATCGKSIAGPHQ